MDSLVAEYGDLLIRDVEETGVELGRGSYGVVFEVRWRGKVLAAKKLHDFFFEPEVRDLPGTKKEMRNFKREFRSWANLDHPNMVRLLGLYYNPSRSIRAPIIVMEKMDVSLGDYLERHTRDTFPLHKKVHVLLQVAQGLSYLHGQTPPLVHHDLKPDNVMLDTNNFTAKLTDFGMIRAITPGSLTRASSVKGTPVFMPPEALEVPLRYDEQLDVFSFGVVVISTLVHNKAPLPLPATVSHGGRQVAVSDIDRRKPFTNQFTVEEKHLFMPVVEQCLQYSPEKRPRSSQLVDRMRSILASQHNAMSPGAAEGNRVKQNALCLQLSESSAEVLSQSETALWRRERPHETSARFSSAQQLLESSASEIKMLKEKVARLEKQCSQAEAERNTMEESHITLQKMYEEVYLENDSLKLQCKEAASHSETEHRLAQADRAALRKQCQQLLEERKIISDNSAELHQKLADMEYELKGLREFKARYNTKERRELEQTNAELHQKLFDMEAELEKLRPFKDQATSRQSNNIGSAANSRPLCSPTSPASPGGGDSGQPLPPGWQSRLTSDGTRYYINCETKSVSWSRPDADWSKSV